MSQEEHDAWVALGRVAAPQHGLLTSAQISAHFTRDQRRRRVERGLLVPAATGIWRLPSAPMTWRQDVMLGCLAGRPGAAASHTCAGALWELEGILAGSLQLTVPRGQSRMRIRRVHLDGRTMTVHQAELDESETLQRGSLRLTTVPRTLVDMAGQLTPYMLGRVVDHALRQRLITLDELAVARARRRVRGVGRLDPIIEERQVSGIGDSEWEDRVWDWIISAGLPAPVRQYEVSLPSMAAVLDFAYPAYKVAVEFDGYASHHSRINFDRDRVRNSELCAAGWGLVMVTSTQAEAFAVRLVRRALESKGWSPEATPAPPDAAPPATSRAAARRPARADCR